jgi:hypothetical protein
MSEARCLTQVGNFIDMIYNCQTLGFFKSLQAERCSLFLVDKQHKELVAKVFDGNILPDGTIEVLKYFDLALIKCKISATSRS